MTELTCNIAINASLVNCLGGTIVDIETFFVRPIWQVKPVEPVTEDDVLDIIVNTKECLICLPEEGSDEKKHAVVLASDIFYHHRFQGDTYAGPGSTQLRVEATQHSLFFAPLQEVSFGDTAHSTLGIAMRNSDQQSVLQTFSLMLNQISEKSSTYTSSTNINVDDIYVEVSARDCKLLVDVISNLVVGISASLLDVNIAEENEQSRGRAQTQQQDQQDQQEEGQQDQQQTIEASAIAQIGALTLVLFNNTLGMPLVRASIAVEDPLIIEKSAEETVSKAIVLFAVDCFNNLVRLWEPLLEPTRFHIGTNQENMYTLCKTPINVNVSVAMLQMFHLQLAPDVLLRDQVTTSSKDLAKLTPYVFKNDCGIPCHIIMELEDGTVVTHAVAPGDSLHADFRVVSRVDRIIFLQGKSAGISSESNLFLTLKK